MKVLRSVSSSFRHAFSRNDDGDETMDDETFRDFRHSGNLQAGIHTFTVL